MMTVSKRKKPQKKLHQAFHRPSLLLRFQNKHRFSHAKPKADRTIRFRRLVRNINATYQTLCFTISLVVRIFVFIDQITRTIYTFIESFIRLIQFFVGCLILLQTIFSNIHLIVSRLMMLTLKIHKLFQLLASVLQPFVPGGHIETALRTFSRFLHDYYSSRGGCYSLQARTRHVVHIVRARWKKSKFIHQETDENEFYDALEE